MLVISSCATQYILVAYLVFNAPFLPSSVWIFSACLPAKLLQSCLTLCNPMDCSPPGSPVEAKILEWVVRPSSRESSQPRDRNPISCIAGGFSTAEALGKPESFFTPLVPEEPLCRPPGCVRASCLTRGCISDVFMVGGELSIPFIHHLELLLCHLP